MKKLTTLLTLIPILTGCAAMIQNEPPARLCVISLSGSVKARFANEEIEKKGINCKNYSDEIKLVLEIERLSQLQLQRNFNNILRIQEQNNNTNYQMVQPSNRGFECRSSEYLGDIRTICK